MTGSRPEVEGRVVAHLEEIAEQRDSFDRVAARLGEEGFVAAWSRAGTADQVDLKGSVERAYEQIVNDLQGLLDLLEVDANNRGVVPDPRLVRTGATPDERRQWWEAVDRLGADTSRSDTSQLPGRWRRLALYGHLDHDLATQLISWTESRDFLQHAYAQRTEERALQVWAVMHSLRSHLHEVVDAVMALQKR